MLGIVLDSGQLRDLGSDMIANGAPLQAGKLSGFLGEGGGDEGRDQPQPALAGMGKGIATEVHLKR